MSTLAVLQARMSSTRMPGKVLAPLAGQPMIIRQLERVQRAETLDGIVVATSTDPSDDELTRVVEAHGVAVVRGSLDDVLGRFVLAMDAFQPSAVVRLTADCPLASPAVIDTVVRAFHASGADYVSNTMTPTYPDGLDVEVVRADVLREVAREATDPPEREHVTLGVYRRHDTFRVENVAGDVDLSDLRWTVDTPDDYAFVVGVYDELFATKPDFDLDDVLAYLERHPERRRTEADAVRNAALEGIDTGAMNAHSG
ncbi:MAG: glycosyltransferase family protein [Actinobacteria bacterium]|nr:glycosyltransferase family protein [Actinomycetota bacterium]